MGWRDVPVGLMQNDEILNALLAIWKTQHYNSMRSAGPPVDDYDAGFEAGLDAIAQAAGLADIFENEKTRYRLKTRRGRDLQARVIEPAFALVEGW